MQFSVIVFGTSSFNIVMRFIIVFRASMCSPSSGGKGMRGMNLEKTLFPVMGLDTKHE